jgi:hypothetical protein
VAVLVELFERLEGIAMHVQASVISKPMVNIMALFSKVRYIYITCIIHKSRCSFISISQTIPAEIPTGNVKTLIYKMWPW